MQPFCREAQNQNFKQVCLYFFHVHYSLTTKVPNLFVNVIPVTQACQLALVLEVRHGILPFSPPP